MAGGMDLGTGGKGKKPLDMAVNLVPFIDVMAVTIAFLIYASVWTQVGRLEVSQAGSSTEPTATTDTNPPVTAVITEQSVTVTVGSHRMDPVILTRDPKGRLAMGPFVTLLEAVKAEQPTQNAITLSPEDTVRYEDLIRFIDTCTGHAFPSITVTPPPS